MSLVWAIFVVLTVSALITVLICGQNKRTTIDPIVSSYRNAKVGDCLRAKK